MCFQTLAVANLFDSFINSSNLPLIFSKDASSGNVLNVSNQIKNVNLLNAYYSLI